jgi:hypothetical protein
VVVGSYHPHQAAAKTIDAAKPWNALRERDSVDALLAGLIQQVLDDTVGLKGRRSRNRETPMVRRLAMLLTAGLLALTAGPTLAHHSFAMFDRDNQVDLEGVVQEFRFANPHTFIYLAVKQDDGSTVTWSLEGQSPSSLVRDGWTSKTLKVGDELKMRIAPLRSGAPGGAWAANQISFRDGRVLEVSRRAGFPESADVSR